MNTFIAALREFGNAAAFAGGAMMVFGAKHQLARNKFPGNSHSRRKMKRYLRRKISESEAFIADYENIKAGLSTRP